MRLRQICCGVACAGLLCALLGVGASAQVSVGVQSPLAAFGTLGWGPLELALGMPLQFTPDALSAFAEVRWRWASLALSERTLSPYLTAGAGVPWSEPAAWSGWLGVGMEITIPHSALSAFGQLRWTPSAARGLYESLTLGVRLRV